MNNLINIFKHIQKNNFNGKYERASNKYIINNDNIIEKILTNKKLIKQIIIDKQDKNGINILMYAVSRNNIKWCKLLLDNGPDINIQNNNGDTALIIAVMNNNFEICKLLINKEGININIENINKDTALIIAIKNNNFEICKLLIKNKYFNIQNSEFKKALELTFDIEKLNIHNILLILENNKNIDNIDNINYSLTKKLIENIIKKKINEYKINRKINFDNIFKYFYLLSDYYNKNVYEFINEEYLIFTISKELKELIFYINIFKYNFFTLNQIKIKYNNSIGQNVGGLSRQFFDNLEIQISNNKVSEKNILDILSISKMNSNPIFCNNNNIKLLILNNISKEFKSKIEKNLIFNLLNDCSLKESDCSNPKYMFLKKENLNKLREIVEDEGTYDNYNKIIENKIISNIKDENLINKNKETNINNINNRNLINITNKKLINITNKTNINLINIIKEINKEINKDINIDNIIKETNIYNINNKNLIDKIKEKIINIIKEKLLNKIKEKIINKTKQKIIYKTKQKRIIMRNIINKIKEIKIDIINNKNLINKIKEIINKNNIEQINNYIGINIYKDLYDFFFFYFLFKKINIYLFF